MRSILAWIIAVAAIVVLIPSMLRFAQDLQTSYRFENLELRGGALITLGQALAAPAGLFGTAAVVEMLFRISRSLPQTAATPEVRRGWRSTVAKFFLLVALATYVLSAWAAYQFLSRGGLDSLELPAGQGLNMASQIVFYWLTAPLQFVAWAAVIEYLSRIATSLRPVREQT